MYPNLIHRISIIVPVYNVEAYLAECIGSILAQTYRDLELILIDDGSTDGSSNICVNYADRDDRIRYYYQENAGVSAARNKGIELARGEFIAFVDADDMIHPQTLEVLYKQTVDEKSDRVIACSFTRRSFDATGKGTNTVKLIDQATCLIAMVSHLHIIETEEGDCIPFQTVWGKLFPSNLVRGLSFVGSNGEDQTFMCQVYCLVDCIVMVDAPLYFYRLNPQSTTLSPLMKIKRATCLDRYAEMYSLLSEKKMDSIVLARYIERLYKRIFTIRYESDAEGNDSVLQNIKYLHSRFYCSLLVNPHVSVSKKVTFSLFYYIPSIPNFLMRMLDWRASFAEKRR